MGFVSERGRGGRGCPGAENDSITNRIRGSLDLPAPEGTITVGRGSISTKGSRLTGVVVLCFAWSLWLRAAGPALLRQQTSDAIRVRRHLVELTTLGPRPTGSEANQKAEAYVLDMFRRLGARTWVQEGVGEGVSLCSEGSAYQLA